MLRAGPRRLPLSRHASTAGRYASLSTVGSIRVRAPSDKPSRRTFYAMTGRADKSKAAAVGGIDPLCRRLSER